MNYFFGVFEVAVIYYPKKVAVFCFLQKKRVVVPIPKYERLS